MIACVTLTEHFLEVRDEVKKSMKVKSSNTCYVCEAKAGFRKHSRHHWSYHHPDFVITVCSSCHEDLHKYMWLDNAKKNTNHGPSPKDLFRLSKDYEVPKDRLEWQIQQGTFIER